MRSELAPTAEAMTPRVGVPLQARGAVHLGALYIARRVDAALMSALRSGRWAFVLGPRFSGKSSLRMRAARGLQPAVPLDCADGQATPIRWASIEVRSLQAASSGAAYLALCTALAKELQLPTVSGFWQRHSERSPGERFQRFFLEEVASAAARTVILIDDLDALPTLKLEVAEVLAALGQVQEALAEAGPAGALTLGFFSSVPLGRLTAAPLTGVLGEAAVFLLPDFTREELAAFGPALAALERPGEPGSVPSWLDEVFAWTGGHPQLTQHLCQQLVARAPAPAAAEAAVPAPASADRSDSEISVRVERLVESLFLEKDDALPADPCLREMAQAFTRSPQAPALLALYRRLLSGLPVTPDPLDELQRELRLCGLSTEADDAAGTTRLRPRCRIGVSLLGDAWAREQEVRLILQEAIAREATAGSRAPATTLLRGGPLKTAQVWARKHPEALQPSEVRLLLASLEAARSEGEAKHQASAAALQRELRDKTRARLSLGPGGTSTAAPRSRLGPSRPWWFALALAVGLSLCLSLAALGSAHRRLARFEHAAREAAARAARAEQALQALQADQTRRLAAPPEGKEAAPVSPFLVAPGPLAALPAPTGTAPERLARDRRKPAPSATVAERQPRRRAASRSGGTAPSLGTCPDPSRSAD